MDVTKAEMASQEGRRTIQRLYLQQVVRVWVCHAVQKRNSRYIDNPVKTAHCKAARSRLRQHA